MSGGWGEVQDQVPEVVTTGRQMGAGAGGSGGCRFRPGQTGGWEVMMGLFLLLLR